MKASTSSITCSGEGAKNIDGLVEWLDVGARDKAQSVVALAGAVPHLTILDVGCGGGSVLACLAELGFGSKYWACEPSPELLEATRERHIPNLVEAVSEPLETAAFGRTFDLAIVSHVAEHVLDPAALVARALQCAPHVVLEVPIEGGYAGSLRALMRRIATGRSRRANRSGHVQFFSVGDVRRLVAWSGGRVIKERAYFPTAAYSVAIEASGGPARLPRRVLASLAKRLPGSLATRLHYGHLAVLVGRASDEGSWGHNFYFAPRQNTSTIAAPPHRVEPIAKRSPENVGGLPRDALTHRPRRQPCFANSDAGLVRLAQQLRQRSN